VTTIPNFDIATDLKVEFYLPDEASNLFIIGISKLGSSDVLAGEGLFTIGVSLIGGTDVLGDSQYIAFTWQDLGCIVSKAQLSLGGLVQDQLYFQPEPASAQLLLQSLEYDPTFNSSFRPGVIAVSDQVFQFGLDCPKALLTRLFGLVSSTTLQQLSTRMATI